MVTEAQKEQSELALKTWCSFFVMMTRLDRLTETGPSEREAGLVLRVVHAITRQEHVSVRNERLRAVVEQHIIGERRVPRALSDDARDAARALSYDEQIKIAGVPER